MAAVLNSPYTNTYAHTRPRTNSGQYPVDTIGHQAGASLLRANPNLAKSAIPKPNGHLAHSSDRKEQRDLDPNLLAQQQHQQQQQQQQQHHDRFPPGTLASQDSEMDPMQRMPSPGAYYGNGFPADDHLDPETESFEEAAEQQYQQPHQQQHQDHHPGAWPPHMHPADRPMHPGYEEPMDEAMQRAEEEERRARQYASLSPAEQYAMQAKVHGQSHQHFEDDEGSLGSPFNTQGRSAHAQPRAHASQSASAGGSRSHSRNDKGQPTSKSRHAPKTRAQQAHPLAHQGSTTSLAYMSDPNTGAATSTGALSKAELLERMADALRKERAKNKSYMKELQESELEIDAISRLLDKTRAEAASTNSIQLATIASLRRELDRTRQQLDDAREVGADDAERFLGLLDSVQFGSIKDKEAAAKHFASGMFRPEQPSDDEADADFDLRHMVPDSKAEAILGMAASEAGGVSAKARQRAADRHRRLDNALSTIASSSVAKNQAKQRGEVPFPSSEDGNTIRDKGVAPAIDLTSPPSHERPQSAGPSRFGFFRRRRSTTGSKSDLPEEFAPRPRKGSVNKLKRPGSQRRNSDPAMSITQKRALQPRSSMDDARNAKSTFIKKPAHLMPPLVSRAHEGGTWGRSASSDVPRPQEPGRFVINDPDLIIGDEKKHKSPPTGPRPTGGKRRGSFSKIMGKLFPMADPENNPNRKEAPIKA